MNNETINDIIDFLRKEKDALPDLIREDLGIDADKELSQIYDPVSNEYYDVSLEEITEAIRERIIKAVETFEK